MPISRPRTARICFSVRANNDCPASKTSPPAIRTASGSNRIIDKAVRLLPLPDSPTRATVWPAWMEKLKSCTNSLDCSPWGNATDRFCTCSKGRSTYGFVTIKSLPKPPGVQVDAGVDQMRAEPHQQKYWQPIPVPIKTQTQPTDSTKSWDHATFPDGQHQSWCQKKACWGQRQSPDRIKRPRIAPDRKIPAPW